MYINVIYLILCINEIIKYNIYIDSKKLIQRRTFDKNKCLLTIFI